MTITWILFLLVLKHALADLILQSRLNTGDKADLRTAKGYIHATDHALLTFAVFIFFINPYYAVALGLLDFVLHFAIDYSKTKFVRKYGIIQNSRSFWIVQGVDQIAHYSCYMLYTYIALWYVLWPM